MGQIRLAFKNDKMPLRTKPLNSSNSPSKSPPPQNDSLKRLLDRLIVLQPEMKPILERRFKLMVESAERIAARYDPSPLCLVAVTLFIVS